MAFFMKLPARMKVSHADAALIAGTVSRRIRSFSPGDDIYLQGDEPKALYLMLDGWGVRYRHLPDRRRQILGFVLSGDMCATEQLVQARNDHSFGALTEARLAEISRADVDRLLETSPTVACALRWNDAAVGAMQREWLTSLGRRHANERLAHLFCEIFTRLRAIGRVHGTSCEFPVTQADLGDATGLTMVHVNRILQQLRKDGLVELRRKRLCVTDLKQLMRRASFDPAYLLLDAPNADCET